MNKEIKNDNTNANVICRGRTIYFFDKLNDYTILEAIRHVSRLQTESIKKPITLVILSAGGQLYCGFALYDVLRSCKAPLITIGMGLVASMGFIIFLAGDRRLSNKNTRFMNHQFVTAFDGKVNDLHIEHDEMLALQKIGFDIVMERTPMTEKEIRKDINSGDRYYSASEAVKKGIVHQIIPYSIKKQCKSC